MTGKTELDDLVLGGSGVEGIAVAALVGHRGDGAGGEVESFVVAVGLRR